MRPSIYYSAHVPTSATNAAGADPVGQVEVEVQALVQGSASQGPAVQSSTARWPSCLPNPGPMKRRVASSRAVPGGPKSSTTC